MSEPGHLRLVVTAGNALGTELAVDSELELGRLSEEPGRLAGDIEMSRRHARIARSGDLDFTIEDLGSTNGTFVNGVKLDAPALLNRGDTIELGGTTLLVEAVPEAAPAEAEAALPAEPEPEPAPEPEEEPAPEPEDEPEPEPEPEEEPEPEPAAPAPAGAPVLSVRLEIDLAAGEATVGVAGDPATVRLRLADDGWQLVDS